MDKEGIIKLVNTQAEKLFEYKRHDLISEQINLLVVDGDKNSTNSSQTPFLKFSKTHGMIVNMLGRKKGGREFPIEINLSPLQTEDGLLVSAAIRDISDDLQEPLNTITSFISLLEEEHKDKLDKDGKAYISYVKESANRMMVLITDILEYSRIGRKSKLETINCNTIVEQVIKDMNAAIVETKAQVKYNNLPRLKGYPVEIRLLFQNLLGNAIKFHKKDVPPDIKIDAIEENEYWHFIIEDNGIGIDKRHQEKIFVIFQRLHNVREYNGTGIGLAHCKKIVELHQGKIWVESVLNMGSKFHFTLPKTEKST